MAQPLSPRQIQVFALVAEGMTTTAIATRLGLKQSTVKAHVRDVLRKLRAKSRAHAVSIIRENQQGSNSSSTVSPLSPRRQETLELIAHGQPDTAMAEIMRIDVSAVRKYVKWLLYHLNAKNQAHLVWIGFQNEFLAVPCRCRLCPTTPLAE